VFGGVVPALEKGGVLVAQAIRFSLNQRSPSLGVAGTTPASPSKGRGDQKSNRTKW